MLSDSRLAYEVFEQSTSPPQLMVQVHTPEKLIVQEFDSGLADQTNEQSTPLQHPPAQKVDSGLADKVGDQTTPPQQVTAQEFEDNILKLRREGKSMHVIATELGSTYAKVNYAVKHPVSQRNPRGRPKRLNKKCDGANPKKNPKTAIPNKSKQVSGSRPVVLDKPQRSRVRKSREPGHLESDELHGRVAVETEASTLPAEATTRNLFEERENLEPAEHLALGQRSSVAQFERRLICVYTKLMLAEVYVCAGVVLHAANLLLEEMGISASAAPRYLSCRWLVEYLKRHPTYEEEEDSDINVEGLDDFQRRAVAAVHKLVRRGG